MSDTMVNVHGLEVRFGTTRVLQDVSLSLDAGRTVGVVGESGSGKSTLAKALVGLVRPTAGQVWVDGTDVAHATGRTLAAYRRRVQLVPQDPYSSLSPRRTIGQTLAEAVDPARPSVRRHRDVVVHWLERVGLPADAADRYPHEFSGGQRQRVAIARGLVVGPAFMIADEITSALDVSVQAQILDLLQEIRESVRLSLMFISHNLAVVQRVSDEIVVLYRGVVVEHGPAERVFRDPQHWYTRALLDADPGSPDFSLAGTSGAPGALDARRS